MAPRTDYHGPAVKLRFRTKTQWERTKRAAAAKEQSLNRYILKLLDAQIAADTQRP